MQAPAGGLECIPVDDPGRPPRPDDNEQKGVRITMDPEVSMENEDNSTVVPISPRRRRKPAARKPSARARKPRAAAARKKPAASRPSAARPTTIEGVIRAITGGVTVARAAIAEASDQGATAVRRAVGNASKMSRRTVTRLAREWKAMDPKKKARVLAALLTAAAAASAPLVRKTFKK